MIVVSKWTNYGIVQSKEPKVEGGIWKINGCWGGDKYHHQDIPNFHFKMDVSIVYYLNVPFMHPHELVDQYKLNDACH